MTNQKQQMRDAIDAVEMALSGLEIDSIVRLMEGADASVMVKVPLGALRSLGACYPALNEIMNDPAFGVVAETRPSEDYVLVPRDENRASNLIMLIRSIITQANIKAGENLNPAETAALAWKTIGEINKAMIAASPQPSKNCPEETQTPPGGPR